jgi:hypothetical protein
MDRNARIRRLPLALAIGLRLHEAGVTDALIAVGLGIEPEGVPPMLELARARTDTMALPKKPLAARTPLRFVRSRRIQVVVATVL